MCGGGRYDKLVSEFGGGDVPGIGFAAGLERLILLLENSGAEFPEEEKVKIYLAPMGEEATEKAFLLTQELRKAGIIAETDHADRGIKSQFKYADKIGAEYVGVIGSTELQSGAVRLKKMSDGTEREVPFSELVAVAKTQL